MESHALHKRDGVALQHVGLRSHDVVAAKHPSITRTSQNAEVDGGVDQDSPKVAHG